MGNQICCSEKSRVDMPKIKITYVERKNIHKKELQYQDVCSTSDENSQKNHSPFKISNNQNNEDISNFNEYLQHNDFSMSSIYQNEESFGDCMEEKFIISYLQKLQQQLKVKKEIYQFSMTQCFLTRNEKLVMNEQAFIKHSAQCPYCYDLVRNCKRFENSDALNTDNISQIDKNFLRDSFFEFEQQQNKKRYSEISCKISHNNNDKMSIKINKQMQI